MADIWSYKIDFVNSENIKLLENMSNTGKYKAEALRLSTFPSYSFSMRISTKEIINNFL